VKLQTWWCCLTKTGEVGVFRCLGVVVALPMKEGGEGCARRGRESTEGGGGEGVGRCSTLFMAWRSCGDEDREMGVARSATWRHRPSRATQARDRRQDIGGRGSLTGGPHAIVGVAGQRARC
jgi:hypothetical protein